MFNIVHGGREAVDALLTHPKVRAISFVGSTPIARYIYETGTKHGKRVQSNGGAKNYVVVMPDADVDNSVRGVVEAAFGCAGERCMAGSTAVVVGDAAKRFLPPLIDAANAIKVGPTDTAAQPHMGPVITRQHADRIGELIEHGRSEGATIAADGRGVKIADAPNGFFVGATILDHVQPGTMVHHEEIFGPVLNVMRFDDLDAAIELANESRLRQRRVDLHPFGPGGARVQAAGQGRDGRHQHRRARVDGVVSLQRVGRFVSSATCTCRAAKGVQFFTQLKVTTSRWFSHGEGSIWADK